MCKWWGLLWMEYWSWVYGNMMVVVVVLWCGGLNDGSENLRIVVMVIMDERGWGWGVVWGFDDVVVFDVMDIFVVILKNMRKIGFGFWGEIGVRCRYYRCCYFVCVVC